jgi:hypothetical protein
MASRRRKREKWTRAHRLGVFSIVVGVVGLVLAALNFWLRPGTADHAAIVQNRGGDGGSIVIRESIRAGDGGANGAPGGDVNIRAGDGAPAVGNQRAGDGGNIEIRGRDGAAATP